jgi:3-oxoacyl-[acyl-carrier-protein] synthase III
MHAAVSAIEYYLPEKTLSAEDLSAEFPAWWVKNVANLSGVQMRHIAAADECASDLAFAAARKLFDSGVCDPGSIDFVLLCTQSPDYFFPTTACLLQDRLGLPKTAGALDYSLGCSGYIYGLGLAEGLIASGQAAMVLLLTADTQTRLIHPKDKSTKTILGDAAAVTLLTASNGDTPALGPFVYGTDGSGAPNLIVPAGGFRQPRSRQEPPEITDENGNVRTEENLYMNGFKILEFAQSTVPGTLDRLFEKAGVELAEVDLFVFHQANRYMLEQLRREIGIPPEKFCVTLAHCGNTGSSSIPIALKHAIQEGKIRPGSILALVGFGVGYSWGATLLRWSAQ